MEKIESLEALHALESEWRELEGSRVDLLPFQTWEWSVSWWSHFPEARATLRDSLFARALRSGSGELLAVAPLMLTERPAFGPLRLRQLHFFGADPNVTEVRGLLCRSGSEREVYAALAEHLQAERDRWDWMLWSGLPALVEPGSILEKHGEVRPVREISAFILPLPSTWEELRGGLKRNIKESLRKGYNSLERDGHTFSLDVVRDPDQIPGAIEEFIRLHTARAELDGTVRHPNVFDSPVACRFLRDVSQRMARRDVTRVFLLRIGGTVVAARVGFALGGVLYLYYSGYDPAWGRYSVMTTTLAETIKHAIAEGFREVNLSTGRDVSKTRWSPREVVYREGIQIAPSQRSKIAFTTHEYAARAARMGPVNTVLRAVLARRAALAVAVIQSWAG